MATITPIEAAATSASRSGDAEVDREIAAKLVRVAVQHGWVVHQRTGRYFTARRIREGVSTGIGVHVSSGRIRASRAITVDRSAGVDDVHGWLVEPSGELG